VKEEIVNELQRIEEKYNIKVVFACEAGSRAWELHSQDSDYDVRFIYTEHTDRYLSIDPVEHGRNKDVIESRPNQKVDMVGWEITKTLRLFRNSNPSLLEWLNRGDIYLEPYQAIKQLKNMQNKVISQKTCLYHYINMAFNNLRKVKDKRIPVKQALTVLRPLLSALSLKKLSVFPTGNFLSLTENISNGPIRSEIQMLVAEKQESGQNIVLLSDELISWIETEMNSLKKYAEHLQSWQNDTTEQLNQIFRGLLKEVWD
jgi:hypothetical protein